MARIKICGLFRPCDINYVNEARPDFAGFVFAKSRRQVTPAQAAELREALADGITTVGVFVHEPVENMAALVKGGVIDIVQLHGDEEEETIRQLKELVDCPIVKAVNVRTSCDIEQAQESLADYLLLDNGSGGTGKAFDWAKITACRRPFFLAGGINLDNIDRAVREIDPFCVDVSSGAETDGVKDRKKILELVRRIRYVR